MADDLTELFVRVAEIERKQDGVMRHGPVTARKKVEGEWLVRIRTGGTEDKPTLSPWLPFKQIGAGPEGLNLHWVPQVGQNMTMLSPSGDPQQAILIPMFWSDKHKPPSDDADAVVITHPKFKLTLKDGKMTVETAEEIEFNAKQAVRFKVGGSELEVKGDTITAKADFIETVGKTFLGLENKGERPEDKVVTLGGPAMKTFAKV